MANNRRSGGGGGGQFDTSFNRRQQGNNSMDMQSLLGSPPTRQQQQNMNNTGYQTFASFEQSYSRRMESNKGGNDDYFGGGGGGGNFNSNNNSGYGNNDFGPRGGGGNQQQQQFQQGRGSNNQYGGQSGGGGNNAVWNKQNSNAQGMRGGGQDAWNRSGGQGGGGFDDSMMMRGQGQGMQMGQGSNIGQSSDQQQVVMVVPQGNAGGGGIMGMVPVQGTPNPFMMQRQQQQPMQVIVGNLPGLNADAFGQQILAAAARPQYGQGGMPMGGPQMGMGNQRQQQQQQRYDRSIVDGGGDGRRFSARQANGSQHNRSPGRSAAVNRRSDLSNSGGNSANKALNRGPTNNASAITRGNRKRTVLRDRHGVGEEVDRKRAKPTVPAKAAGVQQKNLGNKGKGNKQQQRKRAAELRAAAKKESEAKKGEKKEGDEAKAEGKDDAVEEKGDEKTEGESTEKKPSKYDEFPAAFLVCKICQKVMNDGDSFESHLSGRAHVALVKMLESRFKKRAELLMFESKLSEEEIGIEMDRQRRAGKSGQGGKGSKNYCKMCDCNYTVNWGTHKVSLQHRVLKEYLHPTCRYCSTNFVHRMDWVNHLHSVNHLRKLTELKESGVDVEDQESSSQDELFAINLEIGKEEHATPVLVIRSTDYKAPTKEDLKEMLKDDKGEIALPEGEIEIPKEFVENQAYGEEAITNVEGACCKVCRTYIGNRNDIDAHVKSKPHFGMYVSYLKKIVKYRENLKAAKEKAEKDAIEQAEREKKKAEEEASAAAAAALKKEADALKKEEETPMETESVETPTKEAEAKPAVEVESPAAKVEPTTPAPVAVETKAEAGGDAAVVDETKKTEEVAVKPVAAETPKKDAASTPAKSTPQRGRGGPRGNRGAARGRGSPVGGRGRGGSPRGGSNRGTPRGGGSNWNNRGGRGQARGRGYQR